MKQRRVVVDANMGHILHTFLSIAWEYYIKFFISKRYGGRFKS